MNQTTIPLTAVSREMQKLTDKPVPNYRKLYHAVVSGTVRPNRNPTAAGRWTRI